MKTLSSIVTALEIFLTKNNFPELEIVKGELVSLRQNSERLTLIMLVFNKSDLTFILEIFSDKQTALLLADKYYGSSFDVNLSNDKNSENKDGENIQLHKPNTAPLKLTFISSEKLSKLDLFEYSICEEKPTLGIIAASQNYKLNENERGSFNLFVSTIKKSGFWSIPSNNEPSSESWLNMPIPEKLNVIPARRIKSEADLPSFITLANDPTRIEIIKQSQLKKIELIIESIQDYMTTRHKRLTDRLLLTVYEYTEQEKDYETELESQRNRVYIDEFIDDLKKITKSIKRDSKEKLIGRGLYFQLLEAELSRLDTTSIEEHKSHNSHHLSLKISVFESIQDHVWEQVKSEIIDLNQKQFKEVEKLLSKISTRFNLMEKSFSSSLIENFYSIKHVENLREYMDIKPRYRGERPIRGFIKRLGEGRRAVFMVLMTLSIFGTMVGFNYRDYAFIGFIFLFIFLVSFVYTFYTWKREDNLLLDKEVGKLREQLHSDFHRAISEIERDNVSELEEKINDFRDTITKLHTTDSKTAVEEQRKRLQVAKKLRVEKESMLKKLLEEHRLADESLSVIKLHCVDSQSE